MGTDSVTQLKHETYMYHIHSFFLTTQAIVKSLSKYYYTLEPYQTLFIFIFENALFFYVFINFKLHIESLLLVS